jgi:hypothetical protein
MESIILLLTGQGSIIRIAPNEVAIADPIAIKTIYSISSAFTKVCSIDSLGREQRGLKISATKTTFQTDFYPIWRPSFARYPDLFTNLDEKSHANRRKIVNNLYSMSNIVRSEENIDNCTRTLMEKFHEAAEKGTPIDVSKWAQWYVCSRHYIVRIDLGSNARAYHAYVFQVRVRRYRRTFL